jgi:hypothetical protein
MLRAGVVFFACVFGLGFALGVIRYGLAGAGFDARMLVLAEIPAMLACAWWAAGWCAARFAVPTAAVQRLGMGLVMFALLRLGELGVGVHLMGQTVGGHFDNLLTPRGLAEFAPQALTALFPLIRARLTGR